MAGFFRTRVLLVLVGAALEICALTSCQPASTDRASPQSVAATASPAENTLANAPVRDLSRDEAEGGHILRKHVGQTEEQLRERLERERNITGASTYTDRVTAERVVGAAIAESQAEIQRWLDRSGRRPNLVLDYDSEDPIGGTMNRGENHSHPCMHALVVLKYAAPDDYYVLTSYPECR